VRYAYLLMVAAIAAVIFVDAYRLGIRFGGEARSGSQLGAAGWALGTLVFPVLFVPAYLWRRRRVRAASAPR